MPYFGRKYRVPQESIAVFTGDSNNMIRFLSWFILAAGIPLVGQTQVDLRTQTRDIEFRNAPFTRPVKTGGALPSTCSQGEMYFLTTAVAGANLYGCSPDNAWSLEAGGGGSNVQIQNANIPVGSRPILDLSNGLGVLLAVSDTGTDIAIQPSVDTALIQTRASSQAGATLLCASSSGSGTTYTCALSPSLTTYTTGMVLHWRPDVSGTGGPTTLNVDTLGTLPVKLADGATDPASGDVVAGRMLELWNDGTSFRIMATRGLQGIFGEARPGCDGTVRGRLWFIAGTAGIADSLTVCAKDASDAYAWRTIY
jgi:hypothetical protein